MLKFEATGMCILRARSRGRLHSCGMSVEEQDSIAENWAVRFPYKPDELRATG